MMEQLWLPHLIYSNTDQVDTVRLSDELETSITITREGEFVRSGLDISDEIEIFSGSENRLTMRQTYTKTFQCKYHTVILSIRKFSQPEESKFHR